MSLKVWLPLNGDLRNNGLDNIEVVNNGATVDNNGKIGKCYYLSGNANSYINTNYSTNIGISDFSISLWVKIPTITSGSYYTVCTSKSASAASSGFGIYWNYSQKKFLWSTADGTNATEIWMAVAVDSIVYDKWIHLVMVRNNSDEKKGYFYINGERYELASIPAIRNITIDTKLLLGKCSNGSYPIKAYYNDFRIYDHALSAKEVKELSKGLVCHYKLDSKYIEPTTNLVTTEDCLSSTCYNGATHKYGYGTNTDMYKTVGVFEGRKCTKLYMGTSGLSARPYPYVSNLFVSNGTNQPEYKTLSFDYYGTIGTYIYPYKLGSGSATCNWTNSVTDIKNGVFTNEGNIPVVANKWNHITMTLHGTTDTNAEWGYIIMGDAHTSDVNNYWLFANMQIETKDHETGYAGVGGTRNENIIYDSSGYNYHGINYNSIINNNSSKYSNSTFFDGSNSYIEFDNLDFMANMLPDEWSFSFWVYNQDSGDRSILFSNYGLGGVGGASFGFEKATNELLRVAYNNGTFDKVIPNSTLTVNDWTHIIVTKTKEHLISVYRNGIFIYSYTNDKCNSLGKIYRLGRDSRSDSTMFKGGISDFRIYTTVLSEDDVKELYQVGASIDKNGNVFAYEFKED